MRTTIVPAQITTVEDRIAGNLGLSQLMLLITPIFIGSALFVILPPFFNYATYKIVAIVCFAVVSAVLAIRIRGKILLFWLIVMLRYQLRPQYYVFDKNDLYLRDTETENTTHESEELIAVQKPAPLQCPTLNTVDLVRAEEILSNPAAKPRYEVNKKGELRVHITESV